MKQKSLLLVSMLFAGMGLVSCGVQSAEHPVALTSFTASDPLISRAQALVDKSPGLPDGHTALATALMKASRKSGDFSLNAKALEAVAKALELAPNDITARKLRASLHLSYHQFPEAIEAAKALQAELPSDPILFGVLSDAYLELGDT